MKNTAFNIMEPHVTLAVFAHPDDEVMVAGTLAKLKKYGKVYSLYCTHGEDGPTGNLVAKKDLGAFRAKELLKVKGILNLDGMEILAYPDRYLSNVPKKVLKSVIKERIQQLKPDTVICFDKNIGLYGHKDHVFAGICVQELLEEESLGVKHLLEMTLSDFMLKIALKLSKTFKENYDATKGLSNSNYSVRISNFSKKKMQVVCAHKSQWEVLGDVQPFYNKIPHWLYYRILSREYYYYKKLN